MNAPKPRSRSRGLATVLGATCLAFVAIPATASANIVGHFSQDEYTNALTLSLTSDEEGEPIALACSVNGKVTLNGSEFSFGGNPKPPCGGSGGPQAIEVFGGGGNDTIDFTRVSDATGFTRVFHFCSEGPCMDSVTADGGSGNDTITGGPFGERLNGLYAFEFGVGADTVHGNGGNDEIKGTDQADQLFGGPGQDKFEPGPGNDLARGGPGQDWFDEITWHADADRFFGEGGSDTMYAGGGGDFLDGGPGADGLYGMKGKDRIFGRAGRDYLVGGPARDKLRGGPGRDTQEQ